MPAIAALLDLDLLIAAAVATAAGLMRGFAGFGSAMLMAPVFAVLYGPAAMIALVTLLELAVTVQLVPGAVRQANWRFVGPMGAAALAAMPFGAMILAAADPAVLAKAVAGIVLAFVLVLASGWRYRGPRPLPVTLGLGAVSGMMVATTSMGGPPVLIYMLAGSEAPALHRANIISYFAVLEVGLLAVLWWTGLLDATALLRAILLTPPFLAAAWLGARGFRQASEALYRRIALVFLFGVAVFGLLR